MLKNLFRPADYTGLVVGAALLTALTGCLVGETDHHPRSHPPAQVSYGYADDYDYYPGYEVYYSRSRREYVCRDGSAWVRQPEARGVSLQVLLASPSVRMDFRDSPEPHHHTVIRRYPKNWQRPSGQASAPDDHRKAGDKNTTATTTKTTGKRTAPTATAAEAGRAASRQRPRGNPGLGRVAERERRKTRAAISCSRGRRSAPAGTRRRPRARARR